MASSTNCSVVQNSFDNDNDESDSLFELIGGPVRPKNNVGAILLPSKMKEEKEKPETKRLDLQGIRGFAILSVIGFHFLPKIFPNGYLGVDQFFVLSGFLMCMLLQKSYDSKVDTKQNFVYSSCSIIFSFYFKRLKRIVPLYYFLIFSALLALFFVYPDTAFETNMASGKKALLFVSNRAATQEENYFSMLDIAVDIFTHTWSLSVEVQFYLIIPFLFLIGANILSERLQLVYYVCLGAVSYGLSFSLFTEQQAFYSVFTRVWQFMIGMIAYHVTESSQNIDNLDYEPLTDTPLSHQPIWQKLYGILKFLIMTLMVTLVACPYEFPALILRPIFTIATGILMTPSYNHWVLSSSFLTYFGDISYSLYLIHWPIYAYWKLVMSNGQLWNAQLITLFLLAIFLSIFSYELYEKWYLKLSHIPMFLLSLGLFSLSVGLLKRNDIETWMGYRQHYNFTRLDGLGENKTYTFEEAEYLNDKWSKEDLKNLINPLCDYDPGDGPFGWCRLKGTTGSYKIMVIGNSWAANHGEIIYEECGYKAKTILQGSAIGCDPLFAFNYGNERCKENLKVFENRVAEEKPDYVFLLSRFIDMSDAVNATNIEDDPIFQSMKKQAEKFLESVKYKMFILTAIPEIDPAVVPKIVPTIKNKEDLVQLDKSFILTAPESARRRHAKLIKVCPRCHAIDYKSLFWNTTTETWRFYDVENSGLSYITQIDHLSFHGLELVRNLYSNICRKL